MREEHLCPKECQLVFLYLFSDRIKCHCLKRNTHIQENKSRYVNWVITGCVTSLCPNRNEIFFSVFAVWRAAVLTIHRNISLPLQCFCYFTILVFCTWFLFSVWRQRNLRKETQKRFFVLENNKLSTTEFHMRLLLKPNCTVCFPSRRGLYPLQGSISDVQYLKWTKYLYCQMFSQLT